MKRVSLFLFLVILLISMVSANGISISPSNFQINKTNQIDYTFQINITNQETFKMYNITSQNPIIEIEKFNLESGETKLITAKITSNSNFNGTIKIIGDYLTNLGSSNETEIITIDSEGLDICNLDLIQGDTIIWDNTLFGEVKLKNMNSGEDFQTIQGSSQYNSLFSSPQEFDYAVYKTGLIFSNICHINIRPESGYIHSSEYDANLILDLDIDYEPTTISTNFFSDYYNLNYNSEKEDTFRITNIGSNPAKNVRLSGDWFTFSDNNFDIPTGDYKTITYTINPQIYQTNQTNQTYQKSIIIEGNFDTQEKNFSVYINYKDISGQFADGSYDKEVLKEMVNFYCSIYPDDCPTTIVYGDELDRNITMVLNEDAYREKILSDDRNFELLFTSMGNLTEIVTKIINNNELILNQTNTTARNTEKQADATKGVLSIAVLGLSIFMFLLLTGMITYVYLKKPNSIKLRKIFGKGEVY